MVLKIGEREFTLTKEHVQMEVVDKIIQEEKYTPSVIEPSFGIGRIVYCVFEHCFKQREEDAQRTYFTFPPLIAPVKCSILPLMDKPDLNRVVQEISKSTKQTSFTVTCLFLLILLPSSLLRLAYLR